MSDMQNSELPNELVDEVKSYGCVLFAGAGVTTEQPHKHHSKTFLQHVEEKCKYPRKSKTESFPEVMQYYCHEMDGGRKNRLIREIIEWLEFYAAEGEPNRDATSFFQEIARIPFFRTIVTTNWDPFCERAMNVLVPMVEDQDIPFWDEKKRQVLKIHGCVTRPHTIVATLDDYDACMKDRSRGAVFTKLRDLMATKTFIFAGYSVQDPDFKLIFDEVIKNLGPFRRGAYVIDPKPNRASVREWDTRGVAVLRMSGLAFAWSLVERLEKDNLIPSRALIDRLSSQLRRIFDIHMLTSDKQHLPGGLSSSMYQDGLIHSINQVIYESEMGILMKDLDAELRDYEKTLERCRKAFDPIEVAYWSGRLEPVKRVVSGNVKSLPLFFAPYALKPLNKMPSLNL